MRSLLIVLTVVGVAVARPGFLGLGLGARSLLHSPVTYSTVAAHAPVAAPLAYSTIAAHAPVVAPLSISSQYHAQDELGQYSYGYSGGQSAAGEVKTFDGVTRGGYSYVDPTGKLQTVNYVADAVNGFRVAATNLPVAPEPIAAEPLVAPAPVEDTAEVVAAREAHLAAVAEAEAVAEAAPEALVEVEPAVVSVARAADLLPASVSRKFETVVAPAIAYGAVAPAAVSYSALAPAVAPLVAPVSRFAYSSVAPAPIAVSAPAAYAYNTAVAPVAYSAVAPALAHSHIAYGAHYATPYATHYGAHYGAPYATPYATHYGAHYGASSQYHAQDELGQYSYGYSGGPSAKSEVKTFDGVTHGGYSYVDAEGKLQTVKYIADAAHGFRVHATNLPIAPVAPVAPILETIPDTVEVAALKAEHFAAVEEAKARLSA